MMKQELASQTGFDMPDKYFQVSREESSDGCFYSKIKAIDWDEIQGLGIDKIQDDEFYYVGFSQYTFVVYSERSLLGVGGLEVATLRHFK